MVDREKRVPNEIIAKMNFGEFIQECDRIVNQSDEEIRAVYGDPTDKTRDRFTKLSKIVTPEDYEQQRLIYEINDLKTQGNVLYKSGKLDEALPKYKEGVEKIKGLADRPTSIELESAIRLNIGLVYENQNKTEESVKEYTTVLEKDPYNIQANFRIAMYYKTLNKLDEATKQIKKIVIWDSTEDVIKKAHKSLVKNGPAAEEAAEKTLLRKKMKELYEKKELDLEKKLIDLFQEQGIILCKEELQVMSKPENINGIPYMVDEAFTTRRIIQFFRYPVINDLFDYTELIPAVVQAIKDPKNPLRRTMLNSNPNLSIERIISYIEGIANRDKSIWRNKCFMTLFLGIIVFLIAHVLHLLISRDNEPHDHY